MSFWELTRRLDWSGDWTCPQKSSTSTGTVFSTVLAPASKYLHTLDPKAHLLAQLKKIANYGGFGLCLSCVKGKPCDQHTSGEEKISISFVYDVAPHNLLGYLPRLRQRIHCWLYRRNRYLTIFCITLHARAPGYFLNMMRRSLATIYQLSLSTQSCACHTPQPELSAHDQAAECPGSVEE
ncbi:uncharacterized protein BDV17DRAFT_156467 [Aspergillus undulatus]|uniref:uncharacterized protein n=1 Tax=Aspergillus undulatus TaxID=1810928 RepID=UPI003CCCECD1